MLCGHSLCTAYASMMNKDGSIGLEPGAETVYGTDDTTMVMSEKVYIPYNKKSMEWRVTWHRRHTQISIEFEFYRFSFPLFMCVCFVVFRIVVATLNIVVNRMIWFGLVWRAMNWRKTNYVPVEFMDKKRAKGKPKIWYISVLELKCRRRQSVHTFGY